MQLRIFLVEDSPVIRRTMIETLNELLGECVIGWAATEAEAIGCMKLSNWNVALVDLLLEQGSGLGVANAFRGRAPDRSLFVVTNYATAAMRERCMSGGADRVFDKSTELDSLFAQLSDLQRDDRIAH